MDYRFNTYNGRNSTPADIMEYYSNIVPFLGVVLGETYEIALLDCRSKQLIAIANGHISGRSVGAPMTNLACRIVEKGDWRHSDYIANYSGVSSEGKTLRSSSYYIKYDNELLGMLCINVDISPYTQLSELALKLCGIVPNHDRSAEQPASEIFVDGVANSVQLVLAELYGDNIPEHYSTDERMNILRILNVRKVFLIKGSVPRVAKLLGCSEPTVYRGIRFCEAST